MTPRGPSLLVLAALLGCSNLTEAEAGIVAIEITSPSDTVEVGQTLQLAARALNRNGESVTVAFTWATPDATVSVDATGLVTALEAGTGRVQAASGSLASTVTITVVDPPVTP